MMPIVCMHELIVVAAGCAAEEEKAGRDERKEGKEKRRKLGRRSWDLGFRRVGTVP